MAAFAPAPEESTVGADTADSFGRLEPTGRSLLKTTGAGMNGGLPDSEMVEQECHHTGNIAAAAGSAAGVAVLGAVAGAGFAAAAAAVFVVVVVVAADSAAGSAGRR